MEEDKSEEFYQAIKRRTFKRSNSWPTDYLYKFIVPTDADKISNYPKYF